MEWEVNVYRVVSDTLESTAKSWILPMEAEQGHPFKDVSATEEMGRYFYSFSIKGNNRLCFQHDHLLSPGDTVEFIEAFLVGYRAGKEDGRVETIRKYQQSARLIKDLFYGA